MKKIVCYIIIVLSFLGLSVSMPGQQGINTRVSGTFSEMTILEILNAVENRYGLEFMYDPSYIPYYKIDFSASDQSLYDFLSSLLRSSGMVGVAKDKKTIIIIRKLFLTKDRLNEIYDNWINGIYQPPTSDEELEINAFFGSPGTNTDSVSLKGKIIEEYNQEALIGATIFDNVNRIGTATDALGNYEMLLLPGEYTIEIAYFGYQTIILNLSIYENAVFDVTMNVTPLNIEEVVISAEAPNQAIQEVNIGLTSIDQVAIKELPVFLGEADIIKSLQTLPGVSTVGEGASGFNVRGGNIDQNLVTLEGSRLYNTSHALGFFSVFNVDLIDNVKLYKGNIPARYGGRVSSYLDVDLKDGDFENFKGAGGIGLMSSKFSIEGPVINDKLSMLFGGRASYTDWIALLINAPDIDQSSVNFGDLNFKVTQKLKNGTLSGNAYYSFDTFNFANDFGYKWKTFTSNLDFYSLLNEKWSIALNANAGQYNSQQIDFDRFNGFEYETGIKDYSARIEAIFVPKENQTFIIGAQGLYYDTSPEQIRPLRANSAIQDRMIEKEQARLYSIYLDSEVELSSKISFSAGVRYNNFAALGPYENATYDPNLPRIESSLIGTEFIEEGKSIQKFSDIEPRISINFKIKDNQSIKASYNEIAQYVHLLSNTTASTPVDVWQLSNFHIGPQRGRNYSLGYFLNRKNNTWEHSVEIYYKNVDNIPIFKDLPELVLNPRIETEIINSESRAYGIELSTKKKSGKWTGQIAYTYSVSEIRTLSEFASENINNSNWFMANYDQPHQISLNARYQSRPRSFWVFGFTYNSGRPITLPTGGYFINNTLITDYSDRNDDRIPAYHRFDVGYTMTNAKARIKGVKSSFTISLYNLYGRRNPFSIFFKRDSRNIPRTYRLSVIGTIFPSATYNFTF